MKVAHACVLLMNLSSLTFTGDVISHNGDSCWLLNHHFHLIVTIWNEQILPSLLSIVLDQPESQFNVKNGETFILMRFFKLYAKITALVSSNKLKSIAANQFQTSEPTSNNLNAFMPMLPAGKILGNREKVGMQEKQSQVVLLDAYGPLPSDC